MRHAHTDGLIGYVLRTYADDSFFGGSKSKN